MRWDARIGARLKLRDLHVLLAVAQAGSMAGAAKALSVSQPAVSKAVADMEQLLGVSLLDRTTRGVEPTRYGEMLIRRGRAVFDELRQGVEELEFLADPTAGELKIGAGQPMAEVLVSRIIDRLSRQYPRIVFHVVTSERVAVMEELRQRRVDVVITRLHEPEGEPDIEAEALHSDTFMVVAGSKSRWARSRKVDLAALARESWTLPPLDLWSGRLIQGAFRACGLDLPSATVFSLSQPLRMELAATGRFLTVLPDYLMAFSAPHPGLTSLGIRLAATRRQIGIVTLKKRALSPVARLFIAEARQVGRQISRAQQSRAG